MERLAEFLSARGEVYCTLSYQRERNYLYAEWAGYVVRQNIVDGGTRQLEWARQNAARLGTTVVVNDNRRMRGGWDTAVDWATQEYGPAMHRAGVRLNAVILSQDLLTQLSSEAMIERVAAGSIAMQLFPSLQAVEAWIAEHPGTPAA